MKVSATFPVSRRWQLHFVVVAFVFQAEDGIRDLTVTGVQTCALPILLWSTSAAERSALTYALTASAGATPGLAEAAWTTGCPDARVGPAPNPPPAETRAKEVGRAAWRGRGEISVGAGSLKKKQQNRCA